MKHTAFFLILLFTAALFAADKSKTVTLDVKGMTCESCAGTVEKALKKVTGVEKVKVLLNEKKATIILASGSKTTTAILVKAVSDAGFDATEGKGPIKSGSVMKKGEGNECGDDCCGDECDTDAQSAKKKSSDAKKS